MDGPRESKNQVSCPVQLRNPSPQGGSESRITRDQLPVGSLSSVAQFGSLSTTLQRGGEGSEGTAQGTEKIPVNEVGLPHNGFTLVFYQETRV